MGQAVFVVDDEKSIANVVSFVLREAGFEVETFYDASSALRRASDCLPDILVSDVVMPDMDGVGLAKALRELNPNCKVILMSGNPGWKSSGILQSDEFDGFDGFMLLPKPFPLDQLLTLVKCDGS